MNKCLLKEQHLPSSKVSLVFDLLVAGGRQGLLVVAQHRIGVPRDDAVTDFVGFAPSLFGLGKFAVDQYSLSVWDEERPEIPLLNDIEEQGWSSQYLFTRYCQPVGDLS